MEGKMANPASSVPSLLMGHPTSFIRKTTGAAIGMIIGGWLSNSSTPATFLAGIVGAVALSRINRVTTTTAFQSNGNNNVNRTVSKISPSAPEDPDTCMKANVGGIVGMGLGVLVSSGSIPFTLFASFVGNVAVSSIISEKPVTATVPSTVTQSISNSNTQPSLLVWKIGEAEISVVSHEEELRYLVRTPNEEWGDKIDLGGRSIEQTILYLSQCEVTLRSDGSPIFSKQTCCHTWNVKDDKGDQLNIQLIKKGKDLFWHVNNLTENTSFTMYATNDFAYVEEYLDRFPPAQRDLYRQNKRALFPEFLRLIPLNTIIKPWQIRGMVRSSYLQAIPISERIAYFKDFTLEKIIYRDNFGEDYLAAVEIKRISHISRLDDQKTIALDRENWAITLTDTDPSWMGHAQIVIEGVVEGQYVVRLAHLTAPSKGIIPKTVPAEVKYVQLKDPTTLSYHSKSETWPVDRGSVEKMTQYIQWQVAQQKKGGKPVRYHIAGSDSILAGIEEDRGINWDIVEKDGLLPEGEFVMPNLASPENCITWVQKTVEFAGIYLKKGRHSWIYTTPKEFTQASPSRTDIAKRIRTPANQEIRRTLRQAQLVLIYLSMPHADKARLERAEVVRQKFEENQPRFSIEELEDVSYAFKIELEFLTLRHDKALVQKTSFAIDSQRFSQGKQVDRKLKRGGLNASPLTRREIADLEYMIQIERKMRELEREEIQALTKKTLKERWSSNWEAIVEVTRAKINGNMPKYDKLSRAYQVITADVEANNEFGF